MRRLLIVTGAALTAAAALAVVPIALSNDGAARVTGVIKGTHLSATPIQEHVDVSRSPDFAKNKPQGGKTIFRRGIGPQNTVANGQSQAVELHCPARFTAISGAFLTSSPMVVLSTMSFDPSHRNGIVIRVTNLDASNPEHWFAEVGCER